MTTGRLSGPPEPPGSPVAPSRRRDPLPFVIAGVITAVLLVICCLAGAIVGIRGRDAPSPSPMPVPSGNGPSAQPTSPDPSARPTGGVPRP